MRNHLRPIYITSSSLLFSLYPFCAYLELFHTMPLGRQSVPGRVRSSCWGEAVSPPCQWSHHGKGAQAIVQWERSKKVKRGAASSSMFYACAKPGDVCTSLIQLRCHKVRRRLSNLIRADRERDPRIGGARATWEARAKMRRATWPMGAGARPP